jgi:ESF2/ABP1 family protein
MTTRKHNEFLEAGESDDDRASEGYNSEAEDLRKGARGQKRLKIDTDASEDEDDYEEEEFAKKGTNPSIPNEKDGDVATVDDKTEAKLKRLRKSIDLPGTSKLLSKKNLVATEAAIKRSGVVYLSRIPPFMKPQKLRSLLEPYGPINRIFMTPEDPASHTRRVRNGGNKKRSFTDGWVEYINKSDAKKACELLNAQIIGGKKGTYYHDDVWNLLYLKGFKWNNLTQQIAAENAERASRMRAEISKTTKENKEFVQNVERAKMLEGMEAKKVARRAREEEDIPAGEWSAKVEKVKKGGERARHFKQTPSVPKRKAGDHAESVKQVLSKIF